MRTRIRATVDALRQDIAYAVRGLRRAPVFSATIVLTIVIGVAGNLTTFAVLDRLLFQSPPGVTAPSQLRRLIAHEQIVGRSAQDWEVFSFPDWRDLAASVSGVAAVEGYSTVRDRVLGDDGQRVNMAYITEAFLPLLGVHPARGRFFTAEESGLFPNPIRPVVVSFELWNRAFGRDSAILGRRIMLSGTSFVVVGVAPQGFQGLDLDPVDLWAPLAARATAGRVVEGSSWATNRDSRFLNLIARLGPNQDWDGVLGRLTLRYATTSRSFAVVDSSARISAAPLLEARGSSYLGPLRERSISLATRLGLVSLSVLFVTALNVATLLLMRTVRRRHEIAVRLALGMSRRRLFFQLVVESLLLAGVAGVFSVLVGWWGSRLLRVTLLSTIRWPASGIEPRLVIMAGVLVAIVGLGAGLAPMLGARRFSANALRLDASSSDPTGSRLRASLLGLQTALCVLLIAFAGAFLQSLRAITVTNLGFDADRLISVVERPGSDPQDLAAAIQALPSVASVAISTSDVQPDRERGRFAIRGEAPPPDSLVPSHNRVGHGYFETVGLTMVRGRPFTARDVVGSDPVVVITESAARTLWHGRDPMGDCIFAVGDFATCRRVVGIVRDVRWQLAGAPIPHLYLPLAQFQGGPGRYLLIRTRRPAQATDAAEIESVLRGIRGTTQRPTVSITREMLEPQIKPLRAASTLLLAFGILALILAGSGVYGLMSSEISQRTRELGVRMALGAGPRDVVRVVLRSAVRILAIGIAAGLVGVVLGGRVITAFLFKTSPYDPILLGLVVVTTIVASLVAMLVPAFRAARLDPSVALRAE
jgi:predicted permease